MAEEVQNEGRRMKEEYFTLVFKGNLREFKGNPLKTETPFGVPWVCGLGDAFEEADKLREELEKQDQ